MTPCISYHLLSKITVVEILAHQLDHGVDEIVPQGYMAARDFITSCQPHFLFCAGGPATSVRRQARFPVAPCQPERPGGHCVHSDQSMFGFCGGRSDGAMEMDLVRAAVATAR